MKKVLILCLPAFLFVMLFTQCRKANEPDGTVFNANFYTDSDSTRGTMFLYIDGQYKGELPYIAQRPSCGASYGDGNQPLAMRLKSGTYKIEGKDSKGTVKSSGEIFVSKRSSSGSGGIGGQSVMVSNDCLIVGLSE